MKIVNSIINFLKDSKSELQKVKWPTLSQALQYTLIVVIISLIVAIYLGLLDFIISSFLKEFIFK